MANYSNFLLLFSLFTSSFLFSQNELSNEAYYKVYDSFNSNQNNDLINGQEYIDLYYRNLRRDNHKFYYSDSFLEGSVVYRNQPYYGVKLKYDLLRDLIILESINQKVNLIVLNSESVTEFVLGESKFVRLHHNKDLASFYRNGFFKEIYNGDSYTFFIKCIKDKSEVISGNLVKYTYRDIDIPVLLYKNEYYRINKIKDLITVLSFKKKEIKLFYKKNKKQYKKDKEQFYKRLLYSLDTNIGES